MENGKLFRATLIAFETLIVSQLPKVKVFAICYPIL